MRAKLLFGAASAAMLLAAPAMAQDQPGDAGTQARISLGAPIENEIAPAGDVDWYRLQVQTGMRYSMTLDGVPAEDGSALDPVLAVHDASGNQLAYNDDSNGLNSALQFAPSVSGDVFVEARAFSEEATGRYQLNVTAETLPEDAVGNDASTRARVVPGRAVAGTIDYEGDIDAYRLDARRNTRYHVTLAGNDGSGTALSDPLLVVVDREGNELASNDDSEGSLNSALEFVPRTTGPVFVQAHGYGESQTGAYTLNVSSERLPNDGLASDRMTRGRIASGQSVDGALEFGGDTDWYRVRLVAGQSYRFGLTTASGDSGLSDPLVRLYDAAGQEVAMDDDGGEGLNAYLEYTAPATASYYVEARGFGEDATGGYTLTMRDGDIPSDATTDVSLSADGDFREGMLAPAGDRDWYKLDLAEGQALRISLTSAEGASDALADPYLVLYSADGAEVGRDDDGGEGLNASLEYQAAASGAYFLEVRGFSEDAAGRYALSVTPGEIGASIDTADAIVANSEGRVSMIGAPDDVDWFAIDMVEGRPYRISLDGVDPDPLVDPYLQLFDVNGQQVAVDDDGGPGLGSYITYTSTAGGVYYAAVSSYQGSGAGRYMLRASDTDVPGNVGTDETLSSDGEDSRVSRIDIAGDADNYRVYLESGVRYVIEIKGHGDNPLRDPYLTVFNASNERVGADDDSGDGPDARLRYTPPETGEYYIQATGLGGSTGDYQVSIARQ